MSEGSSHEHQESGFYKGLFYGIVLGIGAVWFFGTKEGKKLKEDLLAKGQAFLENETSTEDEDEVPELPASKP